MAEAAEGNGVRRATAAPAQMKPIPAGTADPLGLVAGTVPATPLKYSVSLAPGQYVQLDDVVVTQRGAAGSDDGPDRRGGDERRGDARGRPVRLRRVPDRAGRAAGRGERGRRGDGDPGRAGDVRAAAAGLAGAAGPRARSATRRCTSTRWAPPRSRSGSAGTASRSTSTSSSSTAPAARTSRSPGYPGSRPRRRSPCSCCTRSSTAGCWRARRTTPRR